MPKSVFKRSIALLLAAALVSGGVHSAAAGNTESGKAAAVSVSEYAEYTAENAAAPNADGDIEAVLENAQGSLGAEFRLAADYNGEKALLWEKGEGGITFEFTAASAGLYNIELTYYLPESGVEPEIGVMTDGKYPYSELEKVALPREWKNSGAAREDEDGNQLTPEQVESGRYITRRLKDSSGVNTEPYLVSLTAGRHTVTILSPNQTVAISAIRLVTPEKTEKYRKPTNEKTDAETLIIEGEDAVYKSSNTLIPQSDTQDSGISPASPYKQKLNYIGGSSYNSPNDTLVWEFEVEKSGYYSLALRYKQADVVNGESLRRLKIDGSTPFEECREIRFKYNPRWTVFDFGDENGEPYYFYLENGKHEISLEVTLGEMSEYYRRLEEVTEALGDEYIGIVKITGDSPDVNRDYELFNQIPELNKRLSEYSEKLSGIISDMQSFTGKLGSQYIAAMKNMKRVIDTMRDRPYTAHQYVKDYYTNYSTLSSWLYDMKNMPLSVDWLELVPSGAETEYTKTGFFGNLIFGAKRLIYSFSADYEKKPSDNKEQIRLWVNWGRDQTMVLDTLIREDFTAKTGISVKLEQVNASLINGILAGNFPDVSLYMARTDPVNLGIRGALADLTEFDDCGEVLSRFQTGAELPYNYNGALYALPDTQNFFIMFYRRDILENLGLTVPKTWTEFLNTATVIQQNNLEVYVPYTQIVAATTVNGGIGGLHLLPTLMLQNGLSFYNEEQTATALTSPKALSVFKYWTDFYRDYQFVKEADFYNRFRVGTMPLGIAQYSVYLTLYDAAPEIKNRWAVACVPSTDGGNGFVAGSGTGCGIVKKSKHKAAAWEFLKWWTAADTQVRYSGNVESVLGMLGRPQTSNVEALGALAWNAEDKANILKQWESVREIPEIPGSYYLTRSVDQAFWQVINGKASVKDAVVKQSRVSDSEIERKIKEYS